MLHHLHLIGPLSSGEVVGLDAIPREELGVVHRRTSQESCNSARVGRGSGMGARLRLDEEKRNIGVFAGEDVRRAARRHHHHRKNDDEQRGRELEDGSSDLKSTVEAQLAARCAISSAF